MNTLKESILKAAKADAIPEGASGLWHVKKWRLAGPFFVEREPTGRGVTIPAGNYTNLFCYTTATLHTQGDLVMHDVPDELATHLDFMLRARGRVLITGLGLGCVARGTLANPAVKHVVVIEKSPDVLKLVGPYMPKDRLTIIHADALEWVKKPDRKFDCAWHDLWTDETAGEPHLQVQHMSLISDIVDNVKFQGAWKFPRYFRRMTRSVI